MENLQMIEQALKLIGIDDNMIVTDTMNISGQFIVDHDVPERIDRMKITVTFEVKII